jgi:aminoglycoside phosphotransferase (APT) family kinase protein
MNDHDIALLLPADRFGNVLAVRSFPHGLSGASVYDVATDAGEFVVRVLPLPETNLEQWHRHITLLRLVAGADIAPHLAWVDEGARTTVSPKITGTLPAALADPATRPLAIASVVETLARLHRLPPLGFAPADPIAESRALWREQSVKPGFPAWASPAVRLIDHAAVLLEADPRRVPSHNDMNPTNVLWDGARAWLVDWDASGLTHPYYDLAVFSMFLRLDDAVALDLLARQEDARISPEQADTFRALRRLGAILLGTMLFRLAGELTAVAPQHLDETPSLLQFYARLRTGELALRSPFGQAMFGAAMLKEAIG